MEPQSKVYKDPVIVLDFQSLYPSIMIAYNYCFTTCLGRLENLKSCDKSDIELGCCQYSIEPKELIRLADENLLYVSPNNVAFVKVYYKGLKIYSIVKRFPFFFSKYSSKKFEQGLYLILCRIS